MNTSHVRTKYCLAPSGNRGVLSSTYLISKRDLEVGNITRSPSNGSTAPTIDINLSRDTINLNLSPRENPNLEIRAPSPKNPS